MADAHPMNTHAVEQESERPRRVTDLDTPLARRFGEHLDEAWPATHGLYGEPAPEFELALDLEGLPAVNRDEADAFVAQPAECIEAAGDQKLDEIGIGAVLGDARHVIEELLAGIGAEIGGRDFLLGEIRHQCLDVVDAVVDDAHGARGKSAVAAGFLLRCGLQHDHRGALLFGRERRTKSRVASAHHNHIRLRFGHAPSPSYSAATAATPPWCFDQAAGSCMNFSTSASFPASNLPLAFATASTSHQVASECSVTPRSRSTFDASGKIA